MIDFESIGDTNREIVNNSISITDKIVKCVAPGIVLQVDDDAALVPIVTQKEEARSMNVIWSSLPRGTSARRLHFYYFRSEISENHHAEGPRKRMCRVDYANAF